VDAQRKHGQVDERDQDPRLRMIGPHQMHLIFNESDRGRNEDGKDPWAFGENGTEKCELDRPLAEPIPGCKGLRIGTDTLGGVVRRISLRSPGSSAGSTRFSRRTRVVTAPFGKA